MLEFASDESVMAEPGAMHHREEYIDFNINLAVCDNMFLDEEGHFPYRIAIRGSIQDGVPAFSLLLAVA